jgi:hypothetical protein
MLSTLLILVPSTEALAKAAGGPNDTNRTWVCVSVRCQAVSKSMYSGVFLTSPVDRDDHRCLKWLESSIVQVRSHAEETEDAALAVTSTQVGCAETGTLQAGCSICCRLCISLSCKGLSLTRALSGDAARSCGVVYVARARAPTTGLHHWRIHRVISCS